MKGASFTEYFIGGEKGNDMSEIRDFLDERPKKNNQEVYDEVYDGVCDLILKQCTCDPYPVPHKFFTEVGVYKCGVCGKATEDIYDYNR